jgi:hypothetical protein
MSGAELAHYFGMDEDRFNALFFPMTQPSLSLIRQSSKKRFMFPDWQRHQRNAPFRTRHIGADLAQEWREIGAPDIEIDLEIEQERDLEVEKKTAATPHFDAKSRCFVGITETDLEEWADTYPATNPELELKRMKQWLLANPKKAVKRNWRKFITNWLTRTQDQGGTKGTHDGKPETSRPAGKTYKASHRIEA